MMLALTLAAALAGPAAAQTTPPSDAELEALLDGLLQGLRAVPKSPFVPAAVDPAPVEKLFGRLANEAMKIGGKPVFEGGRSNGERYKVWLVGLERPEGVELGRAFHSLAVEEQAEGTRWGFSVSPDGRILSASVDGQFVDPSSPSVREHWEKLVKKLLLLGPTVEA